MRLPCDLIQAKDQSASYGIGASNNQHIPFASQSKCEVFIRLRSRRRASYRAEDIRAGLRVLIRQLQFPQRSMAVPSSDLLPDLYKNQLRG